MDTFITYEGLPVNSGGAHSLGKKTVESIYSDTLSFLRNFTNCYKPVELDLTFYSSQDNSYKTLPILWNLGKTFGVPSFHSWDIGTCKQFYYRWKLKPKQIPKGFELLNIYKDLPPNDYGPIVLSSKWHFQFLDEHTRELLTGQDKIPIIDFRQQNSQLYLRLGQKSTISAWFAFPFSSIDDSAYRYLTTLIKQLPFKPSDKHWRIWRLSKNGNWTPSKIEINAS